MAKEAAKEAKEVAKALLAVTWKRPIRVDLRTALRNGRIVIASARESLFEGDCFGKYIRLGRTSGGSYPR